jgi:ParB-like chromosome segregation protein Spo0J
MPMTPGSLFEIVDGVRRAKAFELAGSRTIRAVILNADGSQGSEIVVAIDDLRSPHKSDIDVSTAAKKDRYVRIWQAIQNGQGYHLPPILVQLGSRGTRIRDLGWIT